MMEGKNTWCHYVDVSRWEWRLVESRIKIDDEAKLSAREAQT